MTGAAPTLSPLIEMDTSSVQIDEETGYFKNIDSIRTKEYPSLQDTTYLDHAGTTLYAKSLVESFAQDLSTNLFGNPHSGSASSLRSSRRIDDTRLEVLRFFNASPEDFDVVFVANATAAIKLVADAFRDHDNGFWYGYHADSHTSLVGVRELASQGNRCFPSDAEVESWLSQLQTQDVDTGSDLRLFAYPGQSNMTGQRRPMDWCQRLRNLHSDGSGRVYTLYDAAALLSTSPMDLSDGLLAPDFIALSFYKIFGFPDLGALIVKKDSADVLRKRKYFGGGTVDMVLTVDQEWHAKKTLSLHSRLEDGTVPFHNIIALQSALKTHQRLYGSMEKISRHCTFVLSRLYQALSNLRHSNGTAVCKIYEMKSATNEAFAQGPVLAFNLKDSQGKWIGKSEVEKLATIKGIQLRTGGLCNPGGIANHLELSGNEMRRNFAIGQRCGDDHDVLHGKPTGVVRVSLGAMSNLKDVETLISFIQEFFVEAVPVAPFRSHTNLVQRSSRFVVESLAIFPIKSCAAYKVPPDVPWEVVETGLAWDREWCLVHQGTSAALSQKKHPRMALLRPTLDLFTRVLRVSHNIEGGREKSLEIKLEATLDIHGNIATCDRYANRESNVCGSTIDVQIYTSHEVENFFTNALGVACTLARFPKGGPVRRSMPRMLGAFPGTNDLVTGRSIMLSNESPILLISRSSVNRLNENIKRNAKTGAGKAVTADSFRGNIVVMEELLGCQAESPYIEDDWRTLRIGTDTNAKFEVLGPCQRCQMVCVDQISAQRRQEPFSTLAKTRRRDGRVWFGMHLCPLDEMESRQKRYVQVGDFVEASTSN